MSKNTKKGRIFLKPGSYGYYYSGQKVIGLDLQRAVRDVMRDCGYDCVKCSETNKKKLCSPNDILNPNIREEVETLKSLVISLQAQIDALTP